MLVMVLELGVVSGRCTHGASAADVSCMGAAAIYHASAAAALLVAVHCTALGKSCAQW